VSGTALPPSPPSSRRDDLPVGAAVDPVSATAEFAQTGPPVRRVGPGAVFGWLRRGWSDLWRSPGVSLGIGACCVLVSWALTGAILVTDYGVLILPLVTGFMFAAPLLAIGVYEASRLHEAGERPTFAHTRAALRRNRYQIAFMGALLMLFLYGWLRFATMLAALFLGDDIPPLGAFLQTAFLSREHLDLALVGGGIGAVLASIVFGLSAVSLPMLVDRPVDAVTAAVTSMRACCANPVTMALWAAVIVAVTALGALPGFLGLVIALPLLGHATWYAYRDLVEPSEPEAR
jgi:uncharacterized membrane protein